MHWSQCLLASAVAVAPCAAAGLSTRSGKSINSFTIPLQRRSQQGDEAVVPIYGGMDWVTSANLGGQDMRLQIDTGSADLWVVSTLLPSDFIKSNLSQNRVYDPKKSTTWKQIQGEQFNISYDTGELGASGVIGTETVNIGGATMTGMIIGAATTMFGGQGIIDTVYDGMLGLGWKSQNTEQDTDGTPKNGPTFMEAIQSQLDEPVFTADFNENHTQSISFGFIDSTLYTGDLQKIAINNSLSFWGVDGVTFSMNGKQIGNSSGINLIMDTGGLGTSLDNQTVLDYWTAVKGSQLQGSAWTFPCDTASLPDLTLNFAGGSSATIRGADLNNSAEAGMNNVCKGGLQATQNGIANAGAGFFGSYFTVWNQSEPSIWFAPYSGVDDTKAQNQGDLPSGTATAGGSPPTGTSTSTGTGNGPSTSTSKALAAATAMPGGLGWSVGVGAVAAGVLAAL